MMRRRKYLATLEEVYCSSCSNFLVLRLKAEALDLESRLYILVAFTFGYMGIGRR
jgi:hypothetical protein